MEYKIKFWHEVLNQTLHIIIGAATAHTFFAYMPLHVILFILLNGGALREFWQTSRGKIQPIWVQLMDMNMIAFGGWIWWHVIVTYNINVDLL